MNKIGLALVALVGLILFAIFSIPKADDSSVHLPFIAKESIGMLKVAYSEEKVSSETKAGDFKKHFSFVRETEEKVSNLQCEKNTCLALHNGGVLAFNPAQIFGATDTTRFLTFNLDPDGNGRYPACSLLLFDNGQVTTGANAAHGIPGPGGIDVITKDPDYVKVLYDKP